MVSGSVVQTSSGILSNQDPTRHFACLCPGQPDTVLRLPAGLLLPMNRFLERQPWLGFWAVLHKDRLLKGKPCFVSVPRSITLGATPHRFESEGECIYYLTSYELSKKLFLIAKIGRLTELKNGK